MEPAKPTTTHVPVAAIAAYRAASTSKYSRRWNKPSTNAGALAGWSARSNARSMAWINVSNDLFVTGTASPEELRSDTRTSPPQRLHL